MNTHEAKTQENKKQSVGNAVSKVKTSDESTYQFVDNRPEAIAQRKLLTMANNSPRTLQLKAFQGRAKSTVQRQVDRSSITGGLAHVETEERGVPEWAQEEFKLESMNDQLKRRLTAALGTGKQGGVLAFEKFLQAAAIEDYNRSNAQILLDMVWSLNQVSGFMMQCVKGKRPEVGEKILSSFIVISRDTIGTERQPWGAGNHAAYLDDPAYFQSIFSGPINFLNTTFPSMTQEAKMVMLKSVHGWNHQKGPGQLAEDLFTQDYTPVVDVAREPMTLPASDIKKYMNEDFITLDEIPKVGTVVVDFSQGRWEVSSCTKDNFSLKPI